MKNYRIVFTLLSIGLIFVSCDKNNEKDDGFIYPLTIGNTWEYTRELNLYFYSDSSETQLYYDTLAYTSEVSVSITNKVVFDDTLETYEIIGIENDSANTYTQTQYYENQDDGLYIYAYIGDGPIVLPKMQRNNTIRFKGFEFESYRQLSDFAQQLTPMYRVLSDSLYFEEPPVKTLQYPFKVGNQWTYRENGDPWRMDRLVSGQKELELEIGNFDCYEIKFIYDIDEDGEWDDDIWMADYINDKGLISRLITVLGIEVMGEFPEETGNFFDLIDEYKLTSVSLR